MVKLDANVLRYMSREEFRVLTAVEMGMKNHDLVPTPLICKIAGLKAGGAFKHIGSLHRNKLIVHENKKYDGYRLTYQGYDYLALKALTARGVISGIGSRIGVGKESDIYEVTNDEGTSMVLKIHRLGRTSFRSIKSKRDYLLHRKNASWLYMSRLAAIREYAYMKALYEHDFPVPTPIDQNRHTVLMSRVPAHPFGQVAKIERVKVIYTRLQNMIVRLAEHGLIHCDFNEFNLMIADDERIWLIDFPQMVSTSHRNAPMYFDRDVQCIRTYFRKRFGFHSEEFPTFSNDTTRKIDLDAQLDMSGSKVSKHEQDHFLEYMEAKNNHEDEEGEGDAGESEDEDEGEKSVVAVSNVAGDDDESKAPQLVPDDAGAGSDVADAGVDSDAADVGSDDDAADAGVDSDVAANGSDGEEEDNTAVLADNTAQVASMALEAAPELAPSAKHQHLSKEELRRIKKEEAKRDKIRFKLQRKWKAKGTPDKQKRRGGPHATRNTQKGKQKRENLRHLREAGF